MVAMSRKVRIVCCQKQLSRSVGIIETGDIYTTRLDLGWICFVE